VGGELLKKEKEGVMVVPMFAMISVNKRAGVKVYAEGEVRTEDNPFRQLTILQQRFCSYSGPYSWPVYKPVIRFFWFRRKM